MKPSLKALERFPIELVKRDRKNGGGYEASYPDLGRVSFSAVGKTENAALRKLREVAKSMIAEHISRGIELPDPPPELQYYYSGKFVLRLPTSLHARLDQEAKKETMSLNGYIVSILSDSARSPHLNKIIERQLEEQKHLLSISLNVYQFNLQPRPETQRLKLKPQYSPQITYFKNAAA